MYSLLLTKTYTKVGMYDVTYFLPIKALGNALTNHPLLVIVLEVTSHTKMTLKVSFQKTKQHRLEKKFQLAVFCCMLLLITAAPNKQRPARSLEEYLPPHHPQHTAPSKLKDYLPPDSALSAPIELKASAEPCDCDDEPESKG